MNGYIHSVETFGTVDGPGIRMVVFFQGCPLRCLYCHNPDTWEFKKGTLKSVDDLLSEYEKNKGYYTAGGITATGGEPMMQIEFLTELFTAAKKKGIHTCLDTSGITFPYTRQTKASSDLLHAAHMQRTNKQCSNNECSNSVTTLSTMKKIEQLMKVTDLVMLDIKHIDTELHKKITSFGNSRILAFLNYLDTIKKPVWIRHVVVPGLTDDEGWLKKLGYEIGQYSCIQSLDVLPYHSMGIEKYHKLGIPYPLEGTKDAEKELAQEAKKHILSGMYLRRMNT